MSAAAKAILQKIVTYGFGVYIGVQYGQAARDFYNSLGGLAGQIQAIAADPNYTCESTDALAGTIAKMLADVALKSSENLRDIFNRLKVKKPDKKNDNDTCNPTKKADLKDCYKNIPNIGKLDLNNDELKRFEDALGVKSSICSKK